MAARKYELGICSCEQVEHGTYHAGHKPLAVTAIDSRDVEPLVEAARRGLDELEDVHSPRSGELRAALAPFLDGEGNE